MRKRWIVITMLFVLSLGGCVDLLDQTDQPKRDNDPSETNQGEATQPTHVDYDGPYSLNDFIEVDHRVGEVDGIYYDVSYREAEMPLEDAIIIIMNAIADDEDLVLMAQLFDFSKFGFSAADFPNGIAFKDIYWGEQYNVGITHKDGITRLIIVMVPMTDSDDECCTPVPSDDVSTIPYEIDIIVPEDAAISERWINENHLATAELTIIDVDFYRNEPYRRLTLYFSVKKIYAMGGDDADMVFTIDLYDDQGELLQSMDLFIPAVKVGEVFCCPSVSYVLDENTSEYYRVVIETKQIR